MKPVVLVWLLAASFAAATSAHAQETHLEFAGKPRLVDCDGQPCFRLVVSAVDGQGQPAPVDERAALRVSVGSEDVPVIHRGSARLTPRADAETTPARTRRVWLVLFDTSGSMNQRLSGGNGETKYAVARRQLERLLDSFRDGQDEMAIAPFDSQRVAERIRLVPFETTKAAIIRQMDGLQPRRQGNTALFSAVSEGLQKVKPYVSADAQVSVVLFTDGKNDVGHAGDDPGLLAGDAGLQSATRMAGDIGVTIYAIGYGSPGTEFDEAALQALKFPPASSNYFSVSDEARLTQVFDSIVRRDAQLMTLLVGPLSARREQLSGASVAFRVAAGRAAGESPVWIGNPLAPPGFEGQLTRAERDSWIKSGTAEPAGLSPVLVRLLVVAVYGALLTLLWFAAPRLLWPDRYIPKPAMRPSGANRPAAGRPGAPAPARAGNSMPPPRPGPSVRGAGRPAPNDGTIQVRPPARSSPGERSSSADRPAPAEREPARDTPPRPVRDSGNSPPPRPRDWGGRDSGDATVFIPPSKKPSNQ